MCAVAQGSVLGIEAFESVRRSACPPAAALRLFYGNANVATTATIAHVAPLSTV